jgi:hypothetical protein
VKDKETFQGISKPPVRDQMRGTVTVVLAIIPSEEFDVHFWAVPGDSGKAYQDAYNRRAEARSRHAWEEKTEAGTHGTEMPERRSNRANHKYFEVSHWEL